MSIQANISTFILCGGKSSRMQTEKGFVNYLNKPFIQWVIEAAEPITKDISLVTDNQQYKVFNYPLVSDIYKNKGPIGGIYSALVQTKTDYNLILSCDVPKISTQLIDKYLINNIDTAKDVTFVSDNKKEYPLIALYNKRIASKFLNAIERNNLKLHSLLNELECNNVKVDMEYFENLHNINTKEELKTIEKKKFELG